MSNKKSNGIIYSKVTRADLKYLNLNDTKLLDKLGLEPIPEFVDDDDIDNEMQYLFYRMHYVKCLILGAIFDNQREMAFDMLKLLQPTQDEFMTKSNKKVLTKKKKIKYDKIEIDLTTISVPDIKMLDVNNPYVLESVGLDPNEFNCPPNLSAIEQYKFHKSIFMKTIARAAYIEMQRETVFDRLKILQPGMVSEFEDSESD